MSITRVSQGALSLLFPAPCLGCGGGLPAGGGGRLGLCLSCRGRLRPAPRHTCRCGRPLAGADLPPGYLCGDCRRRPPAFDRLLWGWRYAPPLDAVIRGLKFRRLDYLGRHLGEELWRRFGAEVAGHDLVVAVPLHWGRRLARGFDQAAAIARPLARRSGLPLAAALARGRRTPPQARLPRGERLTSVAGAFRASPGGRLAGRRIVLVDDVATTGATLEAAATALKGAGATWVTALTAGRSWDEGWS